MTCQCETDRIRYQLLESTCSLKSISGPRSLVHFWLYSTQPRSSLLSSGFLRIIITFPTGSVELFYNQHPEGHYNSLKRDGYSHHSRRHTHTISIRYFSVLSHTGWYFNIVSGRQIFVRDLSVGVFSGAGARYQLFIESALASQREAMTQWLYSITTEYSG